MTLSAQEISDHVEIEQLLVRYCHAIDQRDWDAYRAVYTHDAVIDDVSAWPGNSVDAMVAFLSQALERVVRIQHAVSTILIDIDGDTAQSKSVCHCPVVLERRTARPSCSSRPSGTSMFSCVRRTAGGFPSVLRRATSTTCHRASVSTDGGDA